MSYEQMFRDAPVPILVLDVQSWKPLEFNNLAASFMGYSRSEFRELSITDFERHPRPRETHEHIRRILRIGRDSFHANHRAKDGSPRRVAIDISVIQWSGRPAMLTVWHDLRGALHAQPLDTLAPFDQAIRTHIVQALDASGWIVEGRNGAAHRLGLRPSTLRSKMKRLGITRPIPSSQHLLPR
ncbi:MAG: PAS domain S-box protein [Phycisphaerales bacterium]